jgi:hypothetical protein
MIDRVLRSRNLQILDQVPTKIFDRQLPRTWVIAATVLLTLFSFSIRLHQLSLDSFWIDELITIWTSHADNQVILNVRDHPPLLYFITQASIGIFGESEFSVRLPSVLVSLPAIALVIALGRVFNYPLAGILAALLLALSPFSIRHSQEARHYAIFMTVSLATYLLLFLAMKKPTLLRWVGYGLMTTLNLYTHYGAFVVLAVQSFLIAGWAIKMVWQRDFRRLLFPASACLTVILLYAIRIPQLERAFGRTFSNSDTQADLLFWLKRLYPALSTRNDVLAPLLAGLFLIGIIVLIYRREWINLAFSILALFLPLLLINITGADRTANPRYVIHLLPFYLLVAAIALTEFIRWMSRRIGPAAGYASLTIVVGIFLFVSIPLVKNEYVFTIHDWRDIARDLNDAGDNGDVVVAMTLSATGSYNIAGESLHYYLKRGEKQFHYLKANELGQKDTELFNNSIAEDANVWGVVMHWGAPFALGEADLEITPYQGFTYLVRDPSFQGTALKELLHIYDQMLPLARTPQPHCLLKQDEAIIQQKLGNLVAASHQIADALDECAYLKNRRRSQSIIESLMEQLIDTFDENLAAGQTREIRELAMAILLQKPQDKEIRSYIEFANLLEIFEQGRVQVESSAPEPVRRESYGMPPNNYEGDVLLLHPPGKVTYDLTLPEDPTVFRTRIAMVPDSWEWGGDGSTFVVQIRTEDGNVEELFRHYVSNDLSDRYWHPVHIPLGQYVGQEVSISLQTEIGPNGNDVGDWAIWDKPVIWWETEAPIRDFIFDIM